MSYSNLITGVAGLIALGVSARWNWWRPVAGGIPILMYHKIGDPPPGSKLKKLWVSERKFRTQMEYLKNKGYTTISFANLKDHLLGKDKLPPNPVIITFDDGYVNNYTLAFPVLRELELTATIFLVAEAIGKNNFWHDPATETRIPMLNHAQILEMQEYGIEFGSHTMTHKNLLKIDVTAAKNEIAASYNLLNVVLGHPPVAFAYPYGAGADDPNIRDIVKESGYAFACSIHQGKANLKGDLYLLIRLLIRGDDTMYDFHLNLTRGRSRL